MRIRASVAVVVACAAGAAASSAAEAATIVGQTAPVQAETISCSPLEGPQDASGAGAPSYTVPADGVITKFRHRAGSNQVRDADAYGRDAAGADAIGDQSIRMKVWRPTATAGEFTVVGASAPELLTPNALNEFTTRVPVKAGDLLGITMLTDGGICAFVGVNGDHHAFKFASDQPAGATFSGPDSQASGNRWNIEATVEPDADHDNFGDETQDACPTDASTQGPCPVPETTITFRPQFRHYLHSRFRFRSSLPNSTFTCQMDDGAPEPCSSPADYRKLKVGTHRFSVFATSAGGQDDPTPARVTFEVRRKPPHRHHH